MLISMPTGTSTIFGVFQAILALLETGGRTASCRINYRGMKSSPVKSLAVTAPAFMLRCEMVFHGIVRQTVKPKTDQRVQTDPPQSGAGPDSTASAEFPIKNL
jgi:hypothetical protein